MEISNASAANEITKPFFTVASLVAFENEKNNQRLCFGICPNKEQRAPRRSISAPAMTKSGHVRASLQMDCSNAATARAIAAAGPALGPIRTYPGAPMKRLPVGARNH
jgi:hypothetical protein